MQHYKTSHYDKLNISLVFSG